MHSIFSGRRSATNPYGWSGLTAIGKVVRTWKAAGTTKTPAEGPMRGKLKRAEWDEAYLTSLILWF